MTATPPQALLTLLAGGGLPSISDTTLEVLRRCQVEPVAIDDVAAAVQHDAALAAALRRFAGSPWFGIGEDVRSPKRAALVLGLRSVQLLALALSLLEAAPRRGTLGLFDCELFWRRGLVRAVSARALAGAAGIPAQDDAFVAGLLAEIGQVALARALADTYAPVLREAARRGLAWPSAELEHELLGFDHRVVGAALLARAEVPATLALAMEHAREPKGLPESTPAELVRLVHVLRVADTVADALTPAPDPALLEHVHALAREGLGLSAAQSRTLLAALSEPLRTTAALLGLDPTVVGAEETPESEARPQTSATPPLSPR